MDRGQGARDKLTWRPEASHVVQAYLAQKSYKAAIADLRKAVELASSEEKGMIQAILDKAHNAAPEEAAQKVEPAKATAPQMPTAVEEPAEVENPASPSRAESADGDIEASLTDKILPMIENGMTLLVLRESGRHCRNICVILFMTAKGPCREGKGNIARGPAKFS